MVEEDEELRPYLEANGHDVNQMGLRSEAATVVDDVASDEEGSVYIKSPFLPPSDLPLRGIPVLVLLPSHCRCPINPVHVCLIGIGAQHLSSRIESELIETASEEVCEFRLAREIAFHWDAESMVTGLQFGRCRRTFVT